MSKKLYKIIKNIRSYLRNIILYLHKNHHIRMYETHSIILHLTWRIRVKTLLWDSRWDNFLLRSFEIKKNVKVAFYFSKNNLKYKICCSQLVWNFLRTRLNLKFSSGELNFCSTDGKFTFLGDLTGLLFSCSFWSSFVLCSFHRFSHMSYKELTFT